MNNSGENPLEKQQYLYKERIIFNSDIFFFFFNSNKIFVETRNYYRMNIVALFEQSALVKKNSGGFFNNKIYLSYSSTFIFNSILSSNIQ